MRILALSLLLAAIAATVLVFRPSSVRPSLPPPGHLQAKADLVFASAFKRFGPEPVPLASYRGRPVVLYFWATWCKPCREDAKAMAGWMQAHRPAGLALLSIGLDQSDKLERFVREYDIEDPVFVAGQAGIDLARKLGNLHGDLPYAVAIDRAGVFAAQHLGTLRPQDFEALAAAALR